MPLNLAQVAVVEDVLVLGAYRAARWQRRVQNDAHVGDGLQKSPAPLVMLRILSPDYALLFLCCRLRLRRLPSCCRRRRRCRRRQLGMQAGRSLRLETTTLLVCSWARTDVEAEKGGDGS